MKKRILAGFLALVLATLYCAVGLTEEDMNSFDATVMPVFDRTADNWYRSAENRAMFTVLAALEYMMLSLIHIFACQSRRPQLRRGAYAGKQRQPLLLWHLLDKRHLDRHHRQETGSR